MSVHGNQNLLPLFLRKEKNLPPIKANEEISLAFYLLTKDMSEGEKIMSFSRLLWPFLSIQGIVSSHIILDGLLLFSKKGRYSNPPRQPLIGHVLRNVDSRSELDQLGRIMDVLTYKDTEAEEIGEGEESEYHSLQIEGLVNPDFLEALLKLIPLLKNLPIIDYVVLDTPLSTEKALNISEGYRNIINEMKGNGLRWETVSELIGKEVNKWITELIVKLKDIDSRYSSQINKTSSTIDNSQIKEKMDLTRDQIDQWKVNEKRKVIENISILFKSIERPIEDLLKKNRFFSREESLKSKILEEIFPKFESHLVYLKEEVSKFLVSIESINQQYIELKASSTTIDVEAEEKIESQEVGLQTRLQDRDKQLSDMSKEKVEMIKQLEDLKNQIEDNFARINNILQTKKANCLQDAEETIKWSIQDDTSELFAKPIQWMYMPVYAMFLEDEDMMEERMNIIFPGYVSEGVIYEEVADVFKDWKQMVNEKVEDDMKVRSNFEFSVENKNLLEDPNFLKQIQKGTSILRNQNIFTEEIEKKLKENIKLLS